MSMLHLKASETLASNNSTRNVSPTGIDWYLLQTSIHWEVNIKIEPQYKFMWDCLGQWLYDYVVCNV